MEKKHFDGSYGYDVLHKISEQSGIAVPPLQDVHTVINPGPKTAKSIADNFIRYQHEQPPTLGGVTDLTRCLVLFEDYPEIMQYIATRKLGGKVKINENSGYIGIHGHDNNYNIPGENQITTPFAYQVKKVADRIYADIRSWTAYKNSINKRNLTKADKEMFEAKEADYYKKADMEKELFTMLRDVSGIDKYTDEIKTELKRYGGDNLDKSKTNHGFDWLNEVYEIDEEGQIDEKKLKQVLGQNKNHIASAQSKLCNNVIAPLGKSKIINSKELIG